MFTQTTTQLSVMEIFCSRFQFQSIDLSQETALGHEEVYDSKTEEL